MGVVFLVVVVSKVRVVVVVRFDQGGIVVVGVEFRVEQSGRVIALHKLRLNRYWRHGLVKSEVQSFPRNGLFGF